MIAQVILLSQEHPTRESNSDHQNDSQVAYHCATIGQKVAPRREDRCNLSQHTPPGRWNSATIKHHPAYTREQWHCFTQFSVVTGVSQIRENCMISQVILLSQEHPARDSNSNYQNDSQIAYHCATIGVFLR